MAPYQFPDNPDFTTSPDVFARRKFAAVLKASRKLKKLKMICVTGGNVMVARDGIEPPTRGFSVRCSTN
jgi:hypothetical protein